MWQSTEFCKFNVCCAAIQCMLVAGKFVKFCLKNCSTQKTVFSSILFYLCQQQPFKKNDFGNPFLLINIFVFQIFRFNLCSAAKMMI